MENQKPLVNISSIKIMFDHLKVKYYKLGNSVVIKNTEHDDLLFIDFLTHRFVAYWFKMDYEELRNGRWNITISERSNKPPYKKLICKIN